MMSNPTDKNFEESEFSDDEFETQNLPDGENSDATEDTVDMEEFPDEAAVAEGAGEAESSADEFPTQDLPESDESAAIEDTVDIEDVSAEPAVEATSAEKGPSDTEFSDDDFETMDLPEGVTSEQTKETVDLEEFPSKPQAEEQAAKPVATLDDGEETVDLPETESQQTAQASGAVGEAKLISDTAINDGDDAPAEDIGATVIDPQLAETDAPPPDSEPQTIEINDRGEPATAESTYFDSDPEPAAGSILDKPDIMRTINTRDLSPEDAGELQRTLVDDELASAASIADALDPGPPTDVRDSGTVPTDGPDGSNAETQLVIQQRQLIESEPGAAAGTADYELLELLGEGGMGVVYAANQTSIDRQVAIKMLKAKYVTKKKQRDNFLSEAVVTGDLDHPNIVPIYDVGKSESDALFYSMKRVKGTPWRDILKAKNLKENIEILLKVADAIAFAHSRGVIHRDLKPENIMLGDYGEVLVMDWGLALTTSSFAAARSIAATASMGCTPAYAAPELVRGPRGTIGPRSDVYLLGAILYQLVAGEPPHKGKNVLQCLAAATGNKITPTQETGELLDIALEAMQTEPEDRYADVKSFQQAIRDYLSHSESLVLAEHAAEDLQEADQSNEYNDYARAVYGFREALEMWDGNAKAKDGLRRAKLAYARCAQGNGDFDLGMSLLDRSDAEHAKLHTVLKAAKAEVDAREGRLKMARRIGLALAASILVIVSGAAFWINSERQEAVKQQGIAEAQKTIAEGQKKIADNQKVIAEEQRDEADKQRAIAVAQEAIAIQNAKIAEERRIQAVAAKEKEEQERKKAELAKQKEEIAKNEAIEAGKKEMLAKIEAQKARDTAVKAKEEETKAKIAAIEAGKKEMKAKVAALKAKEEETKAKDAAIVAQQLEKKAKDAAVIAQQEQEYESYVAKIGLAAERIAANNFNDAIRILEKLKSTSPDLIDWEWHRLTYLTAPKQIPVNASGMIDAVAFRPDAKAFVVGGQNGTAFIWNAASPRNRTRLNHGADVAAVAYSRSGQQIATGGNDGIVKIWDAKSDPPRVVRELKGHTDRVTGVVFAPDQTGKRVSVKKSLPENWLVSTSYDGTAVLWNAETGRKIHTFRGHSYRVWSAAFSPRGDLLVTVGEDRRAVVWSLEPDDGKTPKPYKKLTEFSGHLVVNKRDGYPVRMPIYAVAFSHDGKLVATGGDDGRVRIWDPTQVEEPKIEDIISSLNDGNQDNALREPASIKGQKSELRGHSSAVHAVSFSFDDKQVLSGSDDNTMKIWDASNGDLIKTLRGHAGWVRSCVFSPAADSDSRQVLSGSHDGQARIWNVDAYAEKLSLTAANQNDSADGRQTVIDHDDAVFAVAFDRSSKYVVTAGRNQKARIWDARSGKLVRLLGRDGAAADEANALQEGHAYLASTVIPIGNGQKILTSALDNTTRIWDAKRGIELARLDDTGTAAAAAVSLDGTLIATGSNAQYRHAVDATGTPVKFRTYPVRLWRTATALTAKNSPLPQMELDGHRERVTAVAFSPDGEYLFSGDNYGKVILWRTADGKQIGDFRGPVQTVNSVLFSADGRRMLAASDDGMVHVWSRNTAKETRKQSIRPDIVLVHDGAVATMALVPGQPLLLTATGGDDRMVRLWNIETGKIVKAFDDLRGRHASRSKRPLITGLSVSPGGDRAFAANSDDNIIHVIDIAARKVVESRSGFGAVWSTAVYYTDLDTTQGKSLKLATVGGDDARVWNLKANDRLQSVELETTLAPHDAVTAAAFSADGQFVVTGGGDSALKMWKVADGTDVFRFPVTDANEQPYHSKGITYVRFAEAEGSNRLLTASGDGSVILWNWDPDPETLKATFVRKFAGHTGAVNCAVFSRDGSLVLTTSSDGTARIWDLSKKDAFVVLKGHKGGVQCGAFSPNGKWAVTGGDDSTARIWDTATGKQLKSPLTGHTDRITSVDVSPDGTRILTGSLDKTAKLWDPRFSKKQPNGPMKESRQILTLGGPTDGHTDGITSVSFSADGQNGPIVTGSLDGTAILWLAAEPQNDEQKVAKN